MANKDHFSMVKLTMEDFAAGGRNQSRDIVSPSATTYFTKSTITFRFNFFMMFSGAGVRRGCQYQE